MNLKDAFSTYTLTQGQSNLIDELERFLEGNISCFLLKGYAGTGKTFMMKGLTDYLSATKRNFRISAPTGRAAKVISQKTSHKAYTIHKSIYSSKDLKEFKAEQADGTETYKFYYDLRNNEDPANTVYIVDESSMVPNVYSEGEFFRFGSGFLLNDFLRFINCDSRHNQKKIIFIGDNAQLPPVNMNFSPALDCTYLRQACHLESTEFELTDVLRQRTDSGILLSATKLRQALTANIYNQLSLETEYQDIHRTKQEALLSQYLLACSNRIDDETIIVAHSNSSVKEYNEFVRNHFFPGQQFLAVGDKVILVSNNYNHPKMELLNGDFGIVKYVAPVSETRVIKIKRKDEQGNLSEVAVTLAFRDVTIVFMDEEQKHQDIDCKIIENLLYSRHRNLSSDELKAIYVDFKIRNPLLKSETTEFKDAIRNDLCFNALRIKFGYAVTCHKAQGGEWKNTFLNCQTTLGYFNASYFRWLYTGITRAKENLYVLNEPNFTISSSLQPPRLVNFSYQQNVLVLSNEMSETETPFDFPRETPFLTNIFLAISDILKDLNVNITSVKHTSFLEHYKITQGTDAVVFKIHFNSKNRITRIEKPTQTSALTEATYAALIQLENKVIVVAPREIDEPKAEKLFDFEKPFLEEFFESIRMKIVPANILITGIEHHAYCEVYQFERGGLIATYKFWYDGKSTFKKTEIIHTRTTGLTDEINVLLK